jgi:predicted esterase
MTSPTDTPPGSPTRRTTGIDPLAAAVLLLLLSLAAPALPDEEIPYPRGASSQEYAGLRFQLEIPDDFDPGKTYSLLVGLHGMGATETSYASWFTPLLFSEFIVCAPKSTGTAWNKPDVEKVVTIVRHLMEVLPIGQDRLHAAGFSNGGAHLPFLAFTEALPFRTVCFMGSGFQGGKVPAAAKENMSVLALAGEQDPAFGAAKATVSRLHGKVRRVDFRSQPDLDHQIPDELMPFFYHWLRVAEGRFTPGDDSSFPWTDDQEIASEELAGTPRPSFVYFFDDADAKSAAARRLQNETLLDPLVHHYGAQLYPVLLDRELEPEYFKSLGLTKTPAVVVFDERRKAVAKFEGEIDRDQLVKALKSVAKDKAPPK